MKAINNSVSIIIIMTLLFSAFPVNAAQVEKPEAATITEHTPQGRVIVEKDTPDGGGKNWLLIILGAVILVAGVAALAGSSEDSSGGGSSSDPSTATGDVSIGW